MAGKNVENTHRNDAGQGISLKDCLSTKKDADIYSIRSSSEYGDDSFDDYPSPSELMLGCTKPSTSGEDRQGQKALRKKTAISEGDDTFLSDEVWMASLSKFTSDTPQDGHSVPQTVDRDGGRHCEVIDKDMMEETSSHTVLSSGEKEALTPAETSPVVAYHGVKRKPSDTRALGDEDRKRAKEHQPGKEALPPRMSPGLYTTPVPDTRSGDWDVAETSSLPLESTTEWHGIDPSLLNEFKDIIDFF